MTNLSRKRVDKVTGLRFIAISNKAGILPSMKYSSSSLQNIEKNASHQKNISKNIQRGQQFFPGNNFFLNARRIYLKKSFKKYTQRYHSKMKVTLNYLRAYTYYLTFFALSVGLNVIPNFKNFYQCTFLPKV